MGPLQIQSSGQNSQLTSKTAIWLCWLSKNIWHTSSETNESSFRKLNSPTTKLGNIYTSRPGSYVHKPTPCHCNWSQVTHIRIPTSTKMGGVYKVEKSSFFYFKCWWIKVPPATTKCHIPHQSDTPPCWFRFPPWENVNKPMSFNRATTVMWPH